MGNNFRKYENMGWLAGVIGFILLLIPIVYLCTEHPSRNQLCWVEVHQNVATVHVEKGSGVRYVELVVGE